MGQRNVLLLLVMSYTSYGMENKTDFTYKNDYKARPCLSLKKYTEVVGWQKAKNAYEVYRDHRTQFIAFCGAAEKFFSYETEPERFEFFIRQNTPTRRAIINLSAALMDITGSHWPYTRALRAALPEEILVRIGLSVCSDGAVYNERKFFWMDNGRLAPSHETVRTLLGSKPRSKMIIQEDQEDSAVSSMHYRGLCSRLTADEINACAQTRDAQDFSDPTTAAKWLLLKELLYPGVILLDNGLGITIQGTAHLPHDYSSVYDFDVFDIKVQKTLFHRDAITNITRVGQNCVAYCRRERSLNNKQRYVHGVYHLDLNANPIEAKIYTDKRHARIGSLPYGHFVIMVEDRKSHRSDMVFEEPGGCAFIVYNKHRVAIQKVNVGVGVAKKQWMAYSRCTAEDDGWIITVKEKKRDESGVLRGKDHRKTWVHPVIYDYPQKNKPDPAYAESYGGQADDNGIEAHVHSENKPSDIESFDFLLQESMVLGTTASYGTFHSLLTAEKTPSTCIVS